ncbi:alginate export family protein [Phenylobacterium sp.]|uniref:alginate export family protein n=1 Tax=Phenylobacterium sp. TaxID=1871053 RepID=UPI0025CCAD41|nr:alginate export family protein [Phenylobacterium sp.]
MIARRILAGLAASLSAAAAVPAAAEPGAPPTLTTTRFDEDWSRLADPAARTGRWSEPFKYVPLGGASTWLTTGLELRLRQESYSNNEWGGAAAPDDGYMWVRALPYADLHLGQVRAFVQPIAAYAVGVQPAAGPVDRTGLDLLQGFAEVSAPLGETTLVLRAGRQLMPLGSERLVGARYGPNVPLAFDAVRADLHAGRAKVSVFRAEPVRAGPGTFDDERVSAKALLGAYATLPNLDLYYLGFRHRDATFGGRTGDEHRDSFGVRSFGRAGDWRWNVEGVVQTGRFDGRKIRAWTVGSEGGRRFPTAPFSPDLTVRFNVVSGDTDPADGKLGTFNALFPKGKYFGELSPVGPYNIVSLNPGVALDLGNDLSLGLSAMVYWRYARADGVYDVPGNLVRGANGSRARFIGKEVEATLDWQATPELELSASLSAFEAGAFIRETGPAETVGMFGLEANFRF